MLDHSCYRSFLGPYSHLTDICHLAPDYRIIVSLRLCRFSLSIYLRQNTLCFVLWSVLNCFFSHSVYLRQNTLCFVIWSVLNCVFSLSLYLNRTHYVLLYAVYAIVSSALASTSNRTQYVVSYALYLIVPSASSSTLHTAPYLSCIIYSMYNCLFVLSPYFAVKTFSLNCRNLFSLQSESVIYSVKSREFQAEVTFSHSLTEVYFW